MRVKLVRRTGGKDWTCLVWRAHYARYREIKKPLLAASTRAPVSLFSALARNPGFTTPPRLSPYARLNSARAFSCAFVNFQHRPAVSVCASQRVSP